MRTVGVWRLIMAAALAAGTSTASFAQETPESPASREAIIEQAQAAKVKDLHPYVPNKAERIIDRIQDALVNGTQTWHPFFDSAYSGGGFTLGVGYLQHVSPYNYLDVRGSYTIRGYKRAEVEFHAPRLFKRRGSVSLVGGWREATQVGFYGIGPDTSTHDRANYDFQRPYGTAVLSLWPARRLLNLQGAVELTQWSLHRGLGSFPSVDTRYSPRVMPGVGARTTYLHSQGTVALDWRTSEGYTRRGGYYGVTLHDYTDRDDALGFRQVNYEVIQHFPILREAWVISLRGLAQTTSKKSGQEIPFFLLPSVGGGHSLRGFNSWRFRDRDSLLLQAEWRIMANRFFDSAFFYDAGKVAARTSDLDLNGLKSDYGFGVRFHSPFATVLRAEVARSKEGTRVIFTTSPIF